LVDTFDYNIVSWTPSAIVMENINSCSTEMFTIDLNTRKVTGAGYATNKDKDQCKFTAWAPKEGREENWQYQMEDGSRIYQEQRKKAQPFFLKLIEILLQAL
jgi:hypothetical protein